MIATPTRGVTPLQAIAPPRADPSVERVTGEGMTERIYLHDSDGRTWRVYDRAFGLPHAPAHRHRTFPGVGDPRATLRWFQGRDGSARLYRFAKSGDGLADVATLEDQLHQASWRATAACPDRRLTPDCADRAPLRERRRTRE